MAFSIQYPFLDYLDPKSAHHLSVIRQTCARLDPSVKRPCPVHEDMMARATPNRCGPWYRDMDHDPYPGSWQYGDLLCVYPVFRDPDGMWRATPGGVCGFHLLDQDVDRMIRDQGRMVVRDILTNEVVLVDPGGQTPYIPISEWRGSCRMCGACCLTIRASGRLGCDLLAP